MIIVCIFFNLFICIISIKLHLKAREIESKQNQGLDVSKFLKSSSIKENYTRGSIANITAEEEQAKKFKPRLSTNKNYISKLLKINIDNVNAQVNSNHTYQKFKAINKNLNFTDKMRKMKKMKLGNLIKIKESKKDEFIGKNISIDNYFNPTRIYEEKIDQPSINTSTRNKIDYQNAQVDQTSSKTNKTKSYYNYKDNHTLYEYLKSKLMDTDFIEDNPKIIKYKLAKEINLENDLDKKLDQNSKLSELKFANNKVAKLKEALKFQSYYLEYYDIVSFYYKLVSICISFILILLLMSLIFGLILILYFNTRKRKK